MPLQLRDVEVREAEPSDAEAVATFLLAAWREAGPESLGFTGANDAADTALLASVFPSGRVLRIMDDKGFAQFGIIDSVVVATGKPSINLTSGSPLRMRGDTATPCGLREDDATYYDHINACVVGEGK